MWMMGGNGLEGDGDQFNEQSRSYLCFEAEGSIQLSFWASGETILSPSLRSVLRSPPLVLPPLVDDEHQLLQPEYWHIEEGKEREACGWFLCLLLSTEEGEDDDEDDEGE